MSLDISSRYEISQLCKRSFTGNELREKIFCGADIRGVSFANKNLSGVDFSQTLAGISTLKTAGLLICNTIFAMVAAIVIGFSSIFPSFIANKLSQPNVLWNTEISIWTGTAILIACFIEIVRQGIGKSLGVLAIFTIISTGIIFSAIPGKSPTIDAAIGQTVLISLIVASVLAESLAFSIFLSITNTKVISLPVILSLAVAILSAKKAIEEAPTIPSIFIVLTGIMAVALIALSIYVSIKAIKGDPTDQRYKIIS